MDKRILAREGNEQPSTIEYILSGNATIKFMGQGSAAAETRTVGFREWRGNTELYAVDVPRSGKPGDIWNTTLTVWYPTERKEAYVDQPPMQITILTGKGEMPFTTDPEKVKRIYEVLQASRQ